MDTDDERLQRLAQALARELRRPQAGMYGGLYLGFNEFDFLVEMKATHESHPTLQ